VTDFAAPDTWEAVEIAIDALDGALGLSRHENTRLLVIVSDGEFRHDPRTAGQQRLDRLRASGCAVLWLAPDEVLCHTVHSLCRLHCTRCDRNG
jgi:hypothetical protein